jgi:ABC-type multidrug transport system fused ATPase/permease subunit
MIDFLRQLWGFVRPYRVRFFLGLLCGILYGFTNGLLIGVVNVVMQLTFQGQTNLHKKLEQAPAWIRPLSQWLAERLPEINAPTSTTGWVLVVCAIPGIMLVRNVLAYLSIYSTNWSAMRAIADIRAKLFSHLQNLSLGFFSRASTGDLIARITSDTQVLYNIVGGSFSSMVKDPVT